jgi:L-glyceraldehyde 3-phosphate reductase
MKPMSYIAASNRYEHMAFRACGKSGLKLPALSLGLWHNFGDSTPLEEQRALLRTAFDLGIVHFDLANNYGPPAGSSELNFGRLLQQDFKPYRDELIISTKAGWAMWPGPYGSGGSSRKYLLASLDQSLSRLGLDYVDIFYSHRFDADTPLEETMSALATAVQQGKALYVGISSYSAGKTAEAIKLLSEWKVPLLIHQPSYNLFNRWPENGLFDTLGEAGVGCIAFGPLAQGLLTEKYLNGVPENARINRPGGSSLRKEHLNERNLSNVRALSKIAKARGQSLAQMALAWVLRDPRVTSVLLGASSPEQLHENVATLRHLEFTPEELSQIDQFARDGMLNLWEKPSTDQRV